MQTSLLHAILGEIPTHSGIIEINGSISYAPQDPWVFSGSVRQNILFGQPFDEDRYIRVLRVCALEYDLKVWEQHDDTLVGEKVGTVFTCGEAEQVYQSQYFLLLVVDFLVVLNLLLTTNQKKAKIVENHLSPELQMAAAGLLGPELVYLSFKKSIVGD